MTHFGSAKNKKITQTHKIWQSVVVFVLVAVFVVLFCAAHLLGGGLDCALHAVSTGAEQRGHTVGRGSEAAAQRGQHVVELEPRRVDLRGSIGRALHHLALDHAHKRH